MPGEATVTNANNLFGAESISRLVRDNADAYKALSMPGGLVDVARDMLGLEGEDLEYLAAIPTAVQEAIRAAIVDALTDRDDKPAKRVQISYMPAIEFEAQICDYGQAVTIQVRGPHEAASPGAAYAARRAGGVRTKGSRAKARSAKRKPARRRGR